MSGPGRKPGGKNARITVPMVIRMRDLRNAGVPATVIANIMALDYGERPDEKTVRNYTNDNSARVVL